MFAPETEKGNVVMGGRFNDAPYPQLQFQDFGASKQYRVEVQNGGMTVVIGDYTDAGFQVTPQYVNPGLPFVDVAIQGLPGRFIEKLAGSYEIPIPIVA